MGSSGQGSEDHQQEIPFEYPTTVNCKSTKSGNLGTSREHTKCVVCVIAVAKRKKSSIDSEEPVNSTFSGEDFIGDDADEDLVLIFLTEFRSLEQALVRAGFTKAGRSHGTAQPDWARFIRHIERRFRPESSPELQGAVSYLLADPDKVALRRKRLQGSLPGEPSSAHSDILWLSELVQETGNKLTHGIPFLKKADFDAAQITAALLVVEAWSYCDPKVESLLTHVQ
jgi:hypothetical protein